jgi:hypothetical protein
MIAKKKMRVTVRNVHARFHPKKKKFDDFWFVSYYHYYSYRLFYDKVICFFLNSQIHNSYTVPFVSKKIPWGCIFVVYPYMHKFVNVERKFGPLISRPHIAMHDACAHCVQCRPQRICVNSSSCVVARAGLSALVSHRIRMARAFQFEISVCRARVSDSGSAFLPNMRAGGHCGVWSATWSFLRIE